MVGQPVEDELPPALRRNQAAPTHVLQVLGRVGDRQPDAIGQNVDAAFALGKLLQKLQAMRMGGRLRYRRELPEQDVFGTFG